MEFKDLSCAWGLQGQYARLSRKLKLCNPKNKLWPDLQTTSSLDKGASILQGGTPVHMPAPPTPPVSLTRFARLTR